MVAVGDSHTVHPRILAKIAQLALVLDADVELAHCAFNSGPGKAIDAGSASSDREIRKIIETARCQLEAVANHLGQAGIRTKVTVTWDYPSYEGIVREVFRQQPDLLIAQSTRHAKLARLVLTHTDYQLIESCPCPLLLMKSERPYTNPCIVAAIDPMHANAKPAALDQVILKNARMLSDGLGGALHVIHACAPWPKVMERSWELRNQPQPVWAEVCAAYEEKAQARVNELARGANVGSECVHVPWGDAAEQLPAFCDSRGAHIVVMGAVSRSGLRRLFIGHTAERVLDALTCDVLIVKPSDFRSPIDLRAVRRAPKSAQSALHGGAMR
jgi:universal stress protein E